jgi:hypothetical protein
MAEGVSVISAKAGISVPFASGEPKKSGIPAFARMTAASIRVE